MTVTRSGLGLRKTAGLMAVLALVPAAAVAQSKAPAPPPGDAVAGKALFANRCAMCHGQEGQGGGIGPRLKGVYGGKAASQPDQKYSAALTAAHPQWTAANLDAFLTKPQGYVPGTRMMATTPKPEDRRNLIAYLASLKK